jgi:hypothetical protein
LFSCVARDYDSPLRRRHGLAGNMGLAGNIKHAEPVGRVSGREPLQQS